MKKIRSGWRDIFLVGLTLMLVIVVGGIIAITTLLISEKGGLANLLDDKLLVKSFNLKQIRFSDETTKKLVLIDHQESVPGLTSGAVWIEDMTMQKVLYQYHAGDRLLPASTTKMMTALVGMDYYKLDDDLVVTKDALVSGSTMGLNEGERLSFRALVYGMLLNSGNDAAYTIAANYPGGINGFLEAMNRKAVQLGLKNSHFTNPAGFDTPGHYSSAEDLALIAKSVMANDQLAEVVGTKQTTVVAENESKAHNLENLNELLGEEGVIGIKTGYTELSGENLVTMVERQGHRILIVILKSSDRFGETKKLIQWAYRNFTLEWR